MNILNKPDEETKDKNQELLMYLSPATFEENVSRK